MGFALHYATVSEFSSCFVLFVLLRWRCCPREWQLGVVVAVLPSIIDPPAPGGGRTRHSHRHGMTQPVILGPVRKEVLVSSPKQTQTMGVTMSYTKRVIGQCSCRIKATPSGTQ